MIKEVWEFEVVPGGGGKRWAEIADWLTRMAGALKKRELVIDACGLRNDNGSSKTMHTAYMVIDFNSLEDRHAFYQEDFGAASDGLMKENKEKQYVTDNIGHYYYEVYQ